MPESPALPLNPVPRSLLDQFLQELADLGLTDRQVDGHLVFLRLWQKHLHPRRLLDGTPDELPGFATFLLTNGAKRGEARFAREAIEHFYAFTLDRHAGFEERAAWQAHFATPPTPRPAPLWEAIARRFAPHLRRADPGVLAWPEPAGPGGDRPAARTDGRPGTPP